MKESEALKKWCPMVRLLIAPQDATWQNSMLTNRGQIPAANTDTRCIASECAVWKWDTVTFHGKNAVGIPTEDKGISACNGRCGLIR